MATTKKVVLGLIIVALGAIVFLSFTAWYYSNLNWAHIIGMGASVLLLIVFWFWPEQNQPTGPPP
jgi:membrane associated rhomboid family serine protease